MHLAFVLHYLCIPYAVHYFVYLRRWRRYSGRGYVMSRDRGGCSARRARWQTGAEKEGELPMWRWLCVGLRGRMMQYLRVCAINFE